MKMIHRAIRRWWPHLGNLLLDLIQPLWGSLAGRLGQLNLTEFLVVFHTNAEIESHIHQSAEQLYCYKATLGWRDKIAEQTFNSWTSHTTPAFSLQIGRSASESRYLEGYLPVCTCVERHAYVMLTAQSAERWVYSGGSCQRSHYIDTVRSALRQTHKSESGTFSSTDLA